MLRLCRTPKGTELHSGWMLHLWEALWICPSRWLQEPRLESTPSECLASRAPSGWRSMVRVSGSWWQQRKVFCQPPAPPPHTDLDGPYSCEQLCWLCCLLGSAAACPEVLSLTFTQAHWLPPPPCPEGGTETPSHSYALGRRLKLPAAVPFS